ncbi:MAG TPA: ParB/RepB/Spo0J family partition protein [Oligoflexia bacterium]|nr:ParB/RepB/Spo0J family partition protein [Oligoflexia bacterium]HMR25047.1 ParB/RepB/Spo0J family partition protein [Oligoflexia bacterium]
MAQQRKALGRGISSLIRKNPGVIADTETNSNNQTATAQVGELKSNKGFVELNIKDIQVNPRQPRRHFNAQALQELKQSIEQSGVIQPILVREISGGYELVAGERRFRASKMAGLSTIPAVIKNMNDQTQLEIAIVENLQRQDLTPIEEAKGYERLSQEFNLSQAQIAEKVGKDRSTVSNLLRLLKLSPMVQAYVDEGKVSMGHARALLVLDVVQQEQLAKKIIDQGLSVRAVEQWIKQSTESTQKQKSKKTNAVNLDPNLKFVQNKMQQRLGTKVHIKPKGKGGEISITYFNSHDLERMAKLLG